MRERVIVSLKERRCSDTCSKRPVATMPSPESSSGGGTPGSVLAPGGKFLFTSPKQACSWKDVMTGRTSVSLGGEVYAAILAAAGLVLTGEHEDEGGNHYYGARKRW